MKPIEVKLAKSRSKGRAVLVSSSTGETKKLKLFIESIMDDKKLFDTKLTYHKVFSNKLFLNTAIQRGVPYYLFKEIKSNSPFDDEQWSDFLDISTRTLSRYQNTKKHIFKATQSEKIFELAEVISTGKKIFDTEEDFMIFLTTPSPALGFEKPINLIGTSYGKELIMDELHNIEHGIFV